MRKIILTSVIGMALLTSCSKQELITEEQKCEKVTREAWDLLMNDDKPFKGTKRERDSIIEWYSTTYPKCRFHF
jgi:hypothetical protein